MDIHYSRDTYRMAFNPDEKDLYIYTLGTGILHKKNNTGLAVVDTLDCYLIDNTEIFYGTRSKNLKFIDA